MEGIGRGIVEALLFLIIVGFLIGGGLVQLGHWIFDKNYIESKTIIIPEKKLIIENNKVDTLYIYRYE